MATGQWRLSAADRLANNAFDCRLYTRAIGVAIAYGDTEKVKGLLAEMDELLVEAEQTALPLAKTIRHLRATIGGPDVFPPNDPDEPASAQRKAA